MIRSIDISCVTRPSEDPGQDDIITEPPDRILQVAVIGGVLLLRTYILDEGGDERTLEHEVEVPAESVHQSVMALMADEAAPEPERLKR